MLVLVTSQPVCHGNRDYMVITTLHMSLLKTLKQYVRKEIVKIMLFGGTIGRSSSWASNGNSKPAALLMAGWCLWPHTFSSRSSTRIGLHTDIYSQTVPLTDWVIGPFKCVPQWHRRTSQMSSKVKFICCLHIFPHSSARLSLVVECLFICSHVVKK